MSTTFPQPFGAGRVSVGSDKVRAHLGTMVESMRGWGASPAVVEHLGVRRFQTSYAGLAELAGRFAAELERRGIGPGDRVLLWGANSARWIAAFFGCVLRGVLAVPLDAAGSPAFAHKIANETEPRLLVGDRALLEGAALSAPALFLDELDATLPRCELGAVPHLAPDWPLQILFTSGTTGEPKGVVHTHRNLLASLEPVEREIAKYRKYERWVHPLCFLHTLPLSHVFGQFIGLWVAPVLGATVIYESRTVASRLLELIPRERVNVLAAVPRTLGLLRARLLAEEPGLAAEMEAAQALPVAKRWWRFRSVHRRLGLRFWAAVCGGATLSAELEQFWTTLGFALVQGYGLTETAALVTVNHPFRMARGSVGQTLPGRELRLNERGELEVKGAMVAEGSWEGGRIVARKSPWLPTGDLAALGDEGRLRFLGRTGQRLVTAAGLNVYLQDVEAAVEAQGEIEGAVVFGLPGAEGGEEPAAVVVARGGPSPAELAIDRANGNLLAHQQVRRWWVWPELELPRTATGKVRRAEVERWAREQASPAVPTSAGADAAIALLLEVGARRGPEDDEARLDEDWGLDSMGRVALAAALEERLGIGAGDGVASRVRTLGDLRSLVGGLPMHPGVSAGQVQDILPKPDQKEWNASTAAERSDTVALRPRDSAPRPLARMARGPLSGPEKEARGVRYAYPLWPWSAPVRFARFCFTELVAMPLVAMLGAPRVRRERESTTRGSKMGRGRPAPKQWLPRAPAGPANPGPMLLISNHRSAVDPALILYALPPAMRHRVAMAMSGEILVGWENSWNRRALPPAIAEHRRWWGPVAAILVRALFNVFPLPRTGGFRASFAHAGRALDRGFHVLIFPEGRRLPAGTPMRFRPGLGILARESYAPVLPMALQIPQNAERRWLRSGPVISVGGVLTVDPAKTPEAITREMECAVAGLLADSELGKPA